MSQKDFMLQPCSNKQIKCKMTLFDKGKTGFLFSLCAFIDKTKQINKYISQMYHVQKWCKKKNNPKTKHVDGSFLGLHWRLHGNSGLQ